MIELFADRIFDGARFVERPLCITIEGETIASVRSRSADERLPPGGIDARGHTVLPGLIDAHTHIGRAGQFEAHEPPNPGAIVRNLEAALEGGVTTVGDMGCTAALQARQIVQNVEQILALELMAAAQGIDFRKQTLGDTARLGRGTQPAYDLIRQRVPFIAEDTVLYPYIEAVRQLVAGGDLVKATNREVKDIWNL